MRETWTIPKKNNSEFKINRGVLVPLPSNDETMADHVYIAGPSGSGKSTLIRCINRLEEHQRGQIIVNGTELTNDIKNIEKELLKAWQDMPNSFVTSAEKGIGKDELLEFIAFQINETNTRLKNEKEFKKENPSIDIN